MVVLSEDTKKALYPLIEFYLSLVAYFILHMIFVIASDFVEAFNIPPLNIGIYVDKLAAIRALLMVLSDFIEWGITQKGLGDGGNANQSLFGKDKDEWFTKWELRKKWNNSGSVGGGARRWASIISFVGMLVCRCVYLYLVYYSNNKSLSVFITLCLEGFWFGLFQMGFFAIGPEFNAYTSFGIHTMGNIIFFMQVILNYYAKKKPKINCLYRVRVHAWIVVITSIIGLLLWVCFCFWANAGAGSTPNNWPERSDVWSPFLLFLVGAFAEDFAVPGILPFAFLDPEKANLVNYLTPSFFMTGALVTVIFNDWWTSINFKAWSCSSPDTEGQPWHTLWLLNIPKYIAFFIAMWSIHGTYADLRCIIQSRWRVLVLTMTVVVPRAVLETAGYVGVANWAIGRGDFALVDAEYDRTLAARLKTSVANFPVTADTLKQAIGGPDGNTDPKKIKEALANWVNYKYFTSINAGNITADDKGTGGKVTVEISGTQGTGNSTANVVSESTKGVKVTISGSIGNETDKQKNATKIANKIASFVEISVLANKLSGQKVTSLSDLTANKLKEAINGSGGDNSVKKAIQALLQAEFPKVTNVSEVSASEEGTTVNVTLGQTGSDSPTPKGTAAPVKGTFPEVNIQIQQKGTVTNLETHATAIAKRLADMVVAGVRGEGRDYAFADFDAFNWIAWHDVTAMFCRFVYVKFAVGYKSI